MNRSTVFTLATSAALLAASPSLAGGYVQPQDPYVPPLPPQIEDWTGFYIGGQIDLLTNGEDVGFGTDAEFDGTLFGIFAGYRYDFGNIVAGVEIDYVMGSGDYTPTNGPNTGIAQDIDYNSIFRAGVEVGYDAGPALIYGTVGYAALNLNLNLGGPDLDDDGYFYGIGLDYRVTDSIVVGGEILQHEFDDFVVPNNDLSATTFGVNVAFTF